MAEYIGGKNEGKFIYAETKGSKLADEFRKANLQAELYDDRGEIRRDLLEKIRKLIMAGDWFFDKPPERR